MSALEATSSSEAGSRAGTAALPLPTASNPLSVALLDVNNPNADLELSRAAALAAQRWSDCLHCLSSSLPILTVNPWLLLLQPCFLYDYFDSLTETLANLHGHTDDLDVVRSLLQQVYHSFVELGNFAKHQPSFYVDDVPSLKRFIRLLDQVTHKQSDKALYPHILSLLTPTLSRPSLFPLLIELKILSCLFRFAVDRWIPSTSALSIICAMLEMMSSSALMREAMMKEPGWERLCRLAWGTEQGLSREQQIMLQNALHAHADDNQVPREWANLQEEDEQETNHIDEQPGVLDAERRQMAVL